MAAFPGSMNFENATDWYEEEEEELVKVGGRKGRREKDKPFEAVYSCPT